MCVCVCRCMFGCALDVHTCCARGVTFSNLIVPDFLFIVVF